MLTANEIFERTARTVLEEEYGASAHLYAARLSLLYLPMLEDAPQDDLNTLAQQIESFEISQRSLTLLSLEQYGGLSAEDILAVFSSAAFGLAIETLKGDDYAACAGYLSESFEALLEHSGLIDQKLADKHRTVISDTLLDLAYAAKQSEAISLRLKMHLYE